jgi:hypothetical protein
MLSWRMAKKLALALPGAEERDHFGSPSFRVNGKIFAQLSAQEQEPKRAVVKLAPADQAALILLDPATFASIPQWGRHGWTYAKLESIDATLFNDVLRKSWRQVAPKKLVAAFGADKT